MSNLMRHGSLGLCVVLAAIAGGCSPAAPRNETNAVVNWDALGRMVVAVQQPEGTVWYSLEGKAALQVVEGLRENTIAEPLPSRADQTIGGTEFRILAFDQRGGRRHRFLVDFQYVEGMGDKRNRIPHASLLQEGQSKRCFSVRSLIEQVGRPLSMVQFEQYALQFEDVGFVFLYWKN